MPIRASIEKDSTGFRWMFLSSVGVVAVFVVDEDHRSPRTVESAGGENARIVE